MADRASSTALMYDPTTLEHDSGRGHPERPARLEAVLDALRARPQGAALVSPAELDMDTLYRVHPRGHVRQVEEWSRQGPMYITLDTVISTGTYRAALAAAASACGAVDEVMNRRAPSAFAVVRPPGHHATADEAMGFCFFNNVAVAVRHAQRMHGLRRVLIVDWDVHHGNGTQDIFYDDPDVAFFSIHRSPFYPGTGAIHETGSGAGRGTTCNVPVRAGTGDDDYLSIFRNVLQPFAARFRPELILVSAGYDAHVADPLGGMRVTTAGYADLTAEVLALSQMLCPGNLAFVLEGGYDLEALSASVVATVDRLEQPGMQARRQTGTPGGGTSALIQAVREVHGL